MTRLGTTLALLLAAGLALPGTAAPQKKTVHGAIAVDRESGAVGYAYDFKNATDAKREALKQCGQKKCETLASFKNGCAAVARQGPKMTAMPGATRDEAETKALRKCGKDCSVFAWACTK
jgi:hypothetical protein